MLFLHAANFHFHVPTQTHGGLLRICGFDCSACSPYSIACDLQYIFANLRMSYRFRFSYVSRCASGSPLCVGDFSRISFWMLSNSIHFAWQSDICLNAHFNRNMFLGNLVIPSTSSLGSHLPICKRSSYGKSCVCSPSARAIGSPGISCDKSRAHSFKNPDDFVVHSSSSPRLEKVPH